MSGIHTNPFAPGPANPVPAPVQPAPPPPAAAEADHHCPCPHTPAPADASRVDAAAAQASRMGQTGAVPIPPPGGAGPTNESDDAFLKRVYHEELGRAPDAEGFAAWMKNIEGGMPREVLRMHFQTCPEAQMPETKARKAWQGTLGAEGKDPVETIKADPRYAEAKVDTTSLQTATESAAKWVHERFPDLVAEIDKANHAVPENKQKSRQLCYELTGHLIGVLRANGVDAQRLVRYSHNDMGNHNRYVNDAFVLPDGRAIDWLGGEGTERQFHDLDVPSPKTDRNFGVVPLEPGMRLSSSTLGV